MNKIVIAIDGYSGCGKSSTAKEVAKKLGFTYIDSGAMYRATALHFLNENLLPGQFVLDLLVVHHPEYLQLNHIFF